MSTWKIAAVQMDCRIGDLAGNLASIRAKLRDAAKNGARLIIFPECVLSGYCFKSADEARSFAEPLPGPATEAIASDCRELGVFTVFGMLEIDGDRLFNSAALVGPKGLIGTYRKTHLPCLGVDRCTVVGDRPYQVHDLGGLRIGILICYDGSFPEPSRVLALQGADLIVLPTNWPPEASGSARLITPARALENRVYFAAVNRVGTERGFRFIGLSRICDITGDLLAVSEDDRETILYATIDPAGARAKRIVNIPGEYEVDRIADRRPELYGKLVEKRHEV
jgi:predicted amidohydrolase